MRHASLDQYALPNGTKSKRTSMYKNDVIEENFNENNDYVSDINRADSSSLGSTKAVPHLQRERRNLLWCMLIALFTIQSVNMNVEAIVPTHIEHHHPSLNEIHVSFILM